MAHEKRTIRVTRTSTIERVEFVDLEITRKEGSYAPFSRLAVALVEASVAAGQPIDWKVVSEEIKTYPAPEIEADETATPAPAIKEVA